MPIIRPYNDLHNEWSVYDIPVLPNEADTILSLAGDIYDRKHLLDWLKPNAARFKAIMLVLGNHDYWDADTILWKKALRQGLIENNLDNVYFLDNGRVILDGMVFFGGTLWTDYNKQDPLTMVSVDSTKDYKYIRTGGYYNKSWRPHNGLVEHHTFIRNLKELLANPTLADMPFYVISHHPPSWLSKDPGYNDGRVVDGYYYSDLSELILDNPRIKIWHHGHIHMKSDYVLGETRVICNPRGYLPKYPGKGFDPLWVVEI